MQLPKRFVAQTFLVAAALVSPCASHATTHTFTIDQKSKTSLVPVTFTFNGTTLTNALAGTCSSSLDGGAKFDTYCVDLYDSVYVGNLTPSSYSVTVNPIATLAGVPTGGNGSGVGFLYQSFASHVASNIDGAGLQVAIWKMEYDGGGPFTSGAFQFADSGPVGGNQDLVYKAAQGYLNAFTPGSTGTASWYEATTHGTNHINQDFVGPTPAPEPGTFAALGIGTAALGCLIVGKKRARA